ncbi:GIY-YIG nuclease family protein [Mycoplasmopsis adleri]|uniref:GIY-YIG nuclease family protein n=1 Tax=Mycoplasmopsis adleri TaxID=51362 RepID=UPI00387372DC
MTKAEILEKLKTVSTNPGIYLWKDENDNVLYVGKAKNLRNRMHQYFEGAINSYKTNKLVDNIHNFETYITKTNKEALLLERRLIEKYNPEYNILLLDDRRYPYLKIQLLKNGLDISLSRKISQQNQLNTYYYGPFPLGYGSTILLKWLQRIALYENGLKIQNNDPEFWKSQFLKIKEILSFKNNKYLDELKTKMLEAAKQEQFEVALDLKNTLNFLNKYKEDQIIELSQTNNIDVFTYKIDNNVIFITLLFYRFGILINKENIIIPININVEESLRYFLEHYYQNKILPDFFIVEDKFMQLNLNFGDDYKFVSPKIGANKKVLELGLLNLEDYYKNEHLNVESVNEKAKSMLDALKQYVPIDDLTNIVIFDNSNLNNTIPVGVAITYTNGIKNKSLYRKFNLDEDSTRHADVEYMKQSITRFFTSDKNSKNYNLIIVDGGLAQVKEAKKALMMLDLNIPVIGLVKDDNHKTRALIDLNQNEIYFKNQELFNFMSEIQIEVDRFAKSHLRKRHKISSLEGSLSKIKGLGKVMEKKLLEHFKDYSSIYNASLEELEKVVPKNIALKIFNKEYDK